MKQHNDKSSHRLKKNGEGYIGRFDGKKSHGELLPLNYDLRNISQDKNRTK